MEILHKTLALVLACSFPNAAESQAQQQRSLECKGTAQSSIPDEEPEPKEPKEPISMGIVLNFATHTVQGFDYPIMIKDTNDATVVFGGNHQSGSLESIIEGYINPVTGNLEAIEVKNSFAIGNNVGLLAQNTGVAVGPFSGAGIILDNDYFAMNNIVDLSNSSSSIFTFGNNYWGGSSQRLRLATNDNRNGVGSNTAIEAGNGASIRAGPALLFVDCRD